MVAQLAKAQICIIGLGLMGGSLALALREEVKGITAIDINPDTCQQAMKAGVVDQAGPNLTLAQDADIIILAAPVRTIIRHLAELSVIIQHQTLIMDLGSVKIPVIRAMDQLPVRIESIGGHPMCGKTEHGFAAANASLYRGAPFVLCHSISTTERARSLAHQLIGSIGARRLEMDAERHDRIVAMISHMPVLLASSLALSAGESAAADKAVWDLAASGFRDTSRLADTDISMMLDILMANSPRVIEAIDAAQGQLSQLAALIQQGDAEALREKLAQAQKARKEWETNGITD